ncbi:MAG: AMP-binding protein [Gammaproteobacteria bacterium]|nr:AMP-binding protein [Gammaproteobacteria bacterium]
MSGEALAPLEVLDSFAAHDDTLPSLLASRCQRVPDRALLAGEIRPWTYGAAQGASLRIAAALAREGVVAGDRVACVAHNSDLAPLLMLALGHLGAVFVPVNPALTHDEMAYIVGHCDPRILVAQDEMVERVAGVAQALPNAPRVLAASWFEALDAAAAPARSIAHPRPGDPLVIIYTSGTTGFPKGVVHSHRNFVLAAEAFVERLHLQPGERLMAVLPFFHLNALFYSFGGALACGGTLVTMPQFSASRMWRVAAAHGATQLNILAAVGNILGKRPRSEFDPSHRIRKIYGGPISVEMMQTFQQDFGVPELVEGFGMSEIPGAFNNPFDGRRKPGSIGLPARHPRLPGTFAQAKVVDDDLRELPDGQEGELLVKTPISMVEYFRDPAQTADAYVDGWLKTGDIARRDADGYFYFIARKKDIIRRRGENIAGAELDRVIGEHPDVLEAAAIGVPAPLGDEDILAVVVPRSQPAPTPQSIIDWCAPRLAAMKLPRYIVFAESLPHTPSQRVMKHALKKDATLLTRAWDRESSAADTVP